jgi:signal transduction histidine kinase
MREVRATSLAERDRARELERSYEAERLRVQELEDLDRAREDLFSILTHELMHPVASVRSLAVTLSRKWNDLDDRDRREYVDRIDRETRRLRDMAEHAASAGRMVEDTISLSLRLERVRDIVSEAVDAASEMSDRLNVDVEPEIADARLEVDPVRVLQVLRNLLSNAAKYSPQSSPIQLQVRGREEEIEFVVADEGPGIAPEHQPRLFRRFSRVTPSGRKTPNGSGLGLYISRRIVEAHGGTLSVQSEPGRGSTFSFRLSRAGDAR